MGSMSLWHWVVVVLVILLLFGRGKLSELMGDVAKGIKSFKKGMAEDDDAKPDLNKPAASAEPVKPVEPKPIDAKIVDAKIIDHEPAKPAGSASQPVEPGKAG
ncbi:twin-arginine translocase TatA/TatE family subunit [Blastochloris sulfoviridis]|uniref:Sec-independent protein translocase protein TatA n=1 Tax=Blastochloris sulfoviridis TaxID=50712 RepID=A0A5M6I1M7_9HYPH|nr:twin-arginine translocase TatA/TatE family subunit [Blastochloris sulfoviridis]KAA5602083.1 twin-arginine translocase TatA/TatE family subunit [Blastochloris sulfoviridis]